MARISTLLVKAIKDQLTPEEGRELDEWQAEDPAHRILLGNYLNMNRECKTEMIDEIKKINVDAAWEKFRKNNYK